MWSKIKEHYLETGVGKMTGVGKNDVNKNTCLEINFFFVISLVRFDKNPRSRLLLETTTSTHSTKA